MQQNLEVLNVILNAALEHVPPGTRSILAQAAQPHVSALSEALKQLEPAKALAKAPAKAS